MKLSEFWHRAAYYLTVPRCVCCGEPLSVDERALCEECRLSYENMKDRTCSLCFSAIRECTCPCHFLDTHYVHKLIKVTRYVRGDADVPSNALVYALKQDHRDDIFSFIADDMATSIRASGIPTEDALFIGVPRRTRAIRHFGFDHAAILASYLAKRLGGKSLRLLRSDSKRAQKEMHGIERLENIRIRTRFRYRRTDLSGKRIFLIDDIVTTGASMGITAMHLRGMGAKRIVGVCFSIAYMDGK